jgi:heme/copper-type cytochrome/quinol oxidase subunit 3
LATQHALGAPASHLETNTGLDNRKLLMWLFLGSDCLFFGSLISAYLLYRNRNLAPPYPKDLFDIPFTSVSSFILLMSSLAMVLALAGIQKGDLRRMRIWLLATAFLGTLFLAGQAYEFTQFYREGLTLHTNMFGTTFFVLTGFHGAHVTVGVLILLSLVGASLKGKLTEEHALTVELAGLYWHFVDIVWIIIFTMIYLVTPQ